MTRAKLTRLAAASLLAVVLGATGCGRREPPKPALPPAVVQALGEARKSCASANIVIACLDAARPDHVGCYGYNRPTTPELDRLAGEGVRFEHAVTDATYTLAACSSLWTGEYPATHGVSVAGVGMRIPRELTTLPEACRAAGMRTAVVNSTGIIIRPHGFADGVEYFESVYAATPDGRAVPAMQRAWRSWLDQVADERFFLYLHFVPPHHPYENSGQFRGTFDPDYQGTLGPTKDVLPALKESKGQVPERDRQHIIAMYDEALRYADWALGTLVRDLRERGLLDNTILIVFSDHGEAFGEHGHWLHADTVYNELTHFTLVMRLPAKVKHARRTVPGLTQLSDLLPTLASLAGLELPAGQVQGHDLAPHIFGGPEVRSAAFSRCLAEPKLMRSVEITGAKGIFDDGGNLIELYDLNSDPGEKHNLVRKDRELATRMSGIFDAWARQQKYVPEPGVSPEHPREYREKLDRKTVEWLRSMGYL